ncbi:MAG: phospholipase D family protein [Rickettsiales bacterium]|nr:phospholipase D family protein [Rickettsiales bacterium]MCA0254893.1 phospholipase D family protein [Pseudomonadota bacterium]
MSHNYIFRKDMSRRRFSSNLIYKLLSTLGYKGSNVKSSLVMITIGITLGVMFEEIYGIGTWNDFHAEPKEFNVCFTPPSGCLDLIAKEISKAKESVYVQAYGLTSQVIINQLKKAKIRGVDVRILLDGGNLSDNKPVLDELSKAKLNVKFDKMPGIAHNKVMIIDNKKVITGSFNFTNAANTRNAENVLLVNNKQIAQIYLSNWQKRALSAIK